MTLTSERRPLVLFPRFLLYFYRFYLPLAIPQYFLVYGVRTEQSSEGISVGLRTYIIHTEKRRLGLKTRSPDPWLRGRFSSSLETCMSFCSVTPQSVT